MQLFAALIGQGIQKDQIKVEYFGAATDDKDASVAASADAGGDFVIKVKLKGEVIETAVPANKTILDVLLELKKDAPFSCTSGACSTCMAKVTSGKVEMDACYALDDDEVANGYILACQAHPTTPDVVIEFEE